MTEFISLADLKDRWTSKSSDEEQEQGTPSEETVPQESDSSSSEKSDTGASLMSCVESLERSLNDFVTKNRYLWAYEDFTNSQLVRIKEAHDELCSCSPSCSCLDCECVDTTEVCHETCDCDECSCGNNSLEDFRGMDDCFTLGSEWNWKCSLRVLIDEIGGEDSVVVYRRANENGTSEHVIEGLYDGAYVTIKYDEDRGDSFIIFSMRGLHDAMVSLAPFALSSASEFDEALEDYVSDQV